MEPVPGPAPGPQRPRGPVSLWQVQQDLSRALGKLRFGPPVTHVYDPVTYAYRPMQAYFDRWGRGPREVLLLGMNPGPFGMAQTGVPFGDPRLVRDFLGIEAPVDKPKREHPKRPIEGFAGTRGEVSGQRLWGFVRDAFGTPERFFDRYFVLNYCPLSFMEASGKNRTPDKLPPAERGALLARCDEALGRSLALLAPRLLVGVGAFAEERLRAAAPSGFSGRIGRILHPSPASPLANKGWPEAVTKELRALGASVP